MNSRSSSAWPLLRNVSTSGNLEKVEDDQETLDARESLDGWTAPRFLAIAGLSLLGVP